MIPHISLTHREQEIGNLVLVVPSAGKIPAGIFSTAEKAYLKTQVEERKEDVVEFNRYTSQVFVFIPRGDKEPYAALEAARKAGDRIAGRLNAGKAETVTLFDEAGQGATMLALAEGMALGSYQFLKYKQEKEPVNTLKEIEIYSTALEQDNPATRHPSPVTSLNAVLSSVAFCRDLINEPNSYLTATKFAEAVEKMAASCGATTEVMKREKIASLRMGGLLGVNKGSQEPPTFTVIEWKPARAGNKKPLVLVGKGIVYDTGGMNLKTGNTMLNMKDDMSGAAAVAAAVCAIAALKLPVHVVGLMPATDNRPGPKAMVSGDIITMHDGTTVEVVDTDAEGRLILADALSYAKKYDPSLVIDLATLTGSAVRAIGKFGAAAMQVRAADALAALKEAGERVYERLVEFPMWEEYGEQIKSDLADLKNLGPPEAGLITAAKFLEKFTGYPYIHLDIAGPAFADKREGYRGLGGTGFGVRLLVDFARQM
ncbi:MAG TPA: leucyl aminopeptidase [Bacteroidales bacterium]|nr:leucyl aminopeptidase [Bacteroidales bacterium]